MSLCNIHALSSKDFEKYKKIIVRPSLTKLKFVSDRSSIILYYIFLYVALLVLFVLSIESLLERANNSPDQVVDTSGEKLMVGAKYYILPVSATKVTSFVLARVVTNKTCPLDVVVGEGYHGQPLAFTPINQKKLGTVHVSTDLNIKFSTQTSCPQSTVWKIDQFDRVTRKWFVTTGGVVGNPSWRTINNWFKIEKYENDYKLVFCPTFCAYCRVQCRDIGVYEDRNGNKRLALTDVPYKVRFQEAQ
ncbi:kunitz trypsin inhibitor 5-like [Gastrolobium bilobum]|uniref:kunitz trypsin inhibitor 5-like n=1 Tax=Gastrolobium bilobum TaxID=150636 RepID=UPI002AB21B6D|nr:kunitz trypsin inhibitor 5-like [Gastrolobium bilobum]